MTDKNGKVQALVPLLEVPEHRPWATVRWLRRQVFEHRIGYYKVGGKVLLDLDELDRFPTRVDPSKPGTLPSPPKRQLPKAS